MSAAAAPRLRRPLVGRSSRDCCLIGRRRKQRRGWRHRGNNVIRHKASRRWLDGIDYRRTDLPRPAGNCPRRVVRLAGRSRSRGVGLAFTVGPDSSAKSDRSRGRPCGRADPVSVPSRPSDLRRQLQDRRPRWPHGGARCTHTHNTPRIICRRWRRQTYRSPACRRSFLSIWRRRRLGSCPPSSHWMTRGRRMDETVITDYKP